MSLPSVAESRYEFGCRDVAMQRLYKDFEITQNYFSRNQQRPSTHVFVDEAVTTLTSQSCTGIQRRKET
ncbi:hypothetical protein [Nostoc sp.]